MMAYDQMLGVTLVIFAIVLGAEMFTRFLKTWSEFGTAKVYSKD
ncbi:hypothetical protein [Alteribacter salitolerans]|nr:hypothetical protein [Alteribacter salitolerans]